MELQWIPPTKRTGGTAWSPGEIGGYVLQMNGSVLSDHIPSDTVALTVDILWPGEYCFEIAARDLDGQVGPFSDADCWSISPAPPGLARIDPNTAP